MTAGCRALLQFVMSQASTELRGWDWRGRRKEVEELGEDEEGEVVEEGGGDREEL